MTWTKQHDVLICREVLVVQPFQFRHGTHDRGQCWERIAKNLNLVEHPHFIVDQRLVRDRFTKLEKDFKRKKASEERASGISPEEPDELDQALEDITETAREQQEQLLRGEGVKISEKEFELKKRDLELKEKMQEEEIEMRRKEQEIKEREQLMRERELEARLKKDDEIINILRQQLQQQQAILEEVQQQNKLLLSLYHSRLEKKE
eukprot:gene3577-biopygen31